MSDTDIEPLLSLSDAYGIGEKIVEMAERVERLHKVVPGAVASWGFVMDDTEFEVKIRVREGK